MTIIYEISSYYPLYYHHCANYSFRNMELNSTLARIKRTFLELEYCKNIFHTWIGIRRVLGNIIWIWIVWLDPISDVHINYLALVTLDITRSTVYVTKAVNARVFAVSTNIRPVPREHRWTTSSVFFIKDSVQCKQHQRLVRVFWRTTAWINFAT